MLVPRNHLFVSGMAMSAAWMDPVPVSLIFNNCIESHLVSFAVVRMDQQT